MIPKNVKKSIDIITEDPKIKAACEIEQYIQGLYKKRDNIQNESLPDLNKMAKDFLMTTWIKEWRKNPTYNGKRSSPIPDDFGVTPYSIICEHGKIRFSLQVQWPGDRSTWGWGVEIPKKFLKQARFAHRCKRKAKHDILVRKVDDLLVKEFKLPDGEFLLPNWDVERTPTIVGVQRNLSEFQIPYSLEINDAYKVHQARKTRLDEVIKEIEEFQNVLPPRIQGMISAVLGQTGMPAGFNQALMPFFMGRW